LHLKRLYRFQLKRGVSTSDHINTSMKLFAGLVNVNVVIEEEDKALILLSSLRDEGYETFVLTLINGIISLKYSEVTTALVNLELRRKDKESLSSTLVEALTVRGKSPNQRGENRGRSKSRSRYGNRSLTRDQCAFVYKLVIERKIIPSSKRRTS